MLTNSPFIFIVILGFIATPGIAQQKPNTERRQSFEDEFLAVGVSTRKPEQLAAFYTGRGFNQVSIKEITQHCFVGGFIENKKYEALWLILDDWRFYDSNGKEIERVRRDNWKELWKQTKLKQAHQSTFGWTLLPESRDLRPDEHAGGNITLPWQEEPFSVVARLKTNHDKQGDIRELSFHNLRCVK